MAVAILLLLSVGISSFALTAGVFDIDALIYGLSSDAVKINADTSEDEQNYEESNEMTQLSDAEYELVSDDAATSRIAMPAIFANGMVFQRGKTINVFGFCEDPDAVFKVTLGDREGTSGVDENGRFYVELDPIDEPTWNLRLEIAQVNSDKENKVSFGNVAIGEVWVMSGQSNAQLQSGYLEDVEEYALLAESLDNVRAYRATASYSLHEDKIGSGSWFTSISASTVRGTGSTALSAVGYVAAAKLAAELGPDVPIALVHVARGASKIKTWLDYESLVKLSPSEAAKYNECVANGALPEKAHTQIGTCLYNKQIAPLNGYEVAGVMWYQGCGDVNGVALGVEGTSYTEYFKALERVYRRIFGKDNELPFYVIELAPYTQDSSSEATMLSDFKAEQFDFCRELANTYLVSNMTDGGVWGESLFSQGYIHPARKSTIAVRAANMILVNEYGFDFGEEYTNPVPVSVVANGGTVTITFDTDIRLFFGDTVVGFEIFGGSSWRDATGVVDGNKIILSASGVTNAVRVRYGYSPITAELADGTVIEFLSGGVTVNKEQKTLTFTKDGTTYVISDIYGCIRSMDYGNVTNASGIPLPVFNILCD